MAAVAASESDVAFVGVAGRADASEIAEGVSDLGLGGFPQAIDADGSIWVGFEITSQPAFAFVNDDGTVELVRSGLSRDEIRERVEALRSQ